MLRGWFDAAVAGVEGGAAVRAAVERGPEGLRIAGWPVAPGTPLRMLAVGKAAAPMAAAFEQAVGRDLVAGLVVAKAGHGHPRPESPLWEASHPIPDERSAEAGRRALGFAAATGVDALLVVLLSGGASALLACPLDGVSQDEVARSTDAVMRAGGDIEVLNALRRELVATSGGRLARARAVGRTFVLAISDVAGDDFSVLGSGPFSPDPGSRGEALRAVGALGVASALPAAVRARLSAPGRLADDGVAVGDPCFEGVAHGLLASNRDALSVAADAARRAGFEVVVRSSEFEGEARDTARGLVREALAQGPGAWLAGGETTVTVRGGGRGGRSQELALAAALELGGRPGVTLLAAGTDGTDGPTDAAGAFADGTTISRGRRAGVDAGDSLERNDAYGFFDAEGGLLRTGPSGTNVRDVVFVLVEP